MSMFFLTVRLPSESRGTITLPPATSPQKSSVTLQGRSTRLGSTLQGLDKVTASCIGVASRMLRQERSAGKLKQFRSVTVELKLGVPTSPSKQATTRFILSGALPIPLATDGYCLAAQIGSS